MDRSAVNLHALERIAQLHAEAEANRRARPADDRPITPGRHFGIRSLLVRFRPSRRERRLRVDAPGEVGAAAS